MRKLVTATVSAALCMASMLPGIAAAQEYRFTGAEAPRGATATVNLRVPFGGQQQARNRASYGLTLGFGQTVSPGLDGRTSTRSINVADFRFNDGGLSQARVASFDLANLGQDRRLNMTGGGKKTWLVIGAIVVAGIVICIAADCFEDDDDDSPGA